MLHMEFHSCVNSMVLERAYHLQSGSIADMRQPGIPVPTEVSLQNPAVWRAIKKRTPCLEFAYALWRFPGVQFSHPPIIQILSTAHRIREMNSPVIAIVNVGQGCRDAAFRHHRVRFAQQRFADDPDRCTISAGFDRGAQACPACPDHQHIVGESTEFRHLQNSPVVPDSHRT